MRETHQIPCPGASSRSDTLNGVTLLYFFHEVLGALGKNSSQKGPVKTVPMKSNRSSGKSPISPIAGSWTHRGPKMPKLHHHSPHLVSKDSNGSSQDRGGRSLERAQSGSPRQAADQSYNSGQQTRDDPSSPDPMGRASVGSRLHASPTDGWPQRSPIQNDHEQDMPSFSLFTQSFETICSDTDPNMKSSPQESYHSPARTRVQHPPRKIDFSTESNLGDLSPIQLQSVKRAPQPLYQQPPAAYTPEYHNPGAGRPMNSCEYEFPRRSTSATSKPPANQPPTETWANGIGTSTYGPNGYSSTASNPFYVLRSSHHAFEACSFKLPILHEGELCRVNVSQYHTAFLYQGGRAPDAQDIKVARRRVLSAIHAFGGYEKPRKDPQESIFRQRLPQSKEYYNSRFHQRYFVTGKHISWEVEEEPPVSQENGQNLCNTAALDMENDGRVATSRKGVDSSQCSPGSVGPLDNQQKMKYRCKLCGQLKQNHNCPYQKSLQRSIAVMVYPVANAFTADEPGILTKPLSEMNNFVSYDNLSTSVHNSPEAHLSPYSDEEASPQPVNKHHHASTPPTQVQKGPSSTLTLRPEHYRAVTPPKREGTVVSETTGDFQYPHVPLTFRERKRLSDTLFSLAREVPTMASQVGSLLRMARETEDWDLAVSEVLTQVIVALYCGEGDYRLDGLQQYLLGIGISC
eukprot:Nitzschia sp. Nitz4//scaffold68_size99682//55924//58060//NITZ4_004569-RA/size99682-snap-gene-0.9-mRNA-1//-1//CDS//3329556608//193//frame0